MLVYSLLLFYPQTTTGSSHNLHKEQFLQTGFIESPFCDTDTTRIKRSSAAIEELQEQQE